MGVAPSGSDHPDRVKRTDRVTFGAAGTAVRIMQYSAFLSPAIGALRFQPQYVRRTGGDTAAATGAVIRVDDRVGGRLVNRGSHGQPVQGLR